MKKILLATDGSENAIKATREVVKLHAGFPKIEVTVVSVILPGESRTDALDSSNDRDVLKQKRVEKIAGTLALLKEAEVSFHVEILHGLPAETIVAYANNNLFDLIIVGSRGLNSLQEMVLGSVSHKIMKRVHAPVLVVK